MTIRVTIKNEDSRDKAIVSVSQLNGDGTPQSGTVETQLKGGESCEKYVHSGQQLLVKEVQNG